MIESFLPHPLLRQGLAMTLYSALQASRNWEKTIPYAEPPYQDYIFRGAEGVPIFARVAIPDNPKRTIVGTYGITGDLDNQWFLKLLGRKAFAQDCAVVLFDWRAHGKTAELSPALTSDGLYEGEDFVRIAAQAKAVGCPAPFWLTGYSLGGQLALWGVKSAQTVDNWGRDLGIAEKDFGGGAVICPNLDSERSLSYLVKQPLGKYVEKAIAKGLKKLAWRIYQAYPTAIDADAISRANSIWAFDEELVIKPLGFSSVAEYYRASSPLPFLPHLQKPTLMIYAADDPLFDPALIPELQAACAGNPLIDLRLTTYGGHVGYINSRQGQKLAGDSDRWWAWNRVLDWVSSHLAIAE